MTPQILVSAGEASGDRLGAEVLGPLLDRVEVRGLIGPAMRSLGIEEVGPVESLSVMGVSEVIVALPRILRLRRAMMQALERRPQLFVAIDSPDFNLPLARRAKALGVPVLLLGSPQVWAWRKGRARRIAQSVDLVICLLPFEPAIYQALGGAAEFLGHPASARHPHLGPPGLDWALLPGSRPSELVRMLPDMLKAAALVLAANPGSVVRLPVAPGLDPALLAPARRAGVELVATLEAALRPARAALVASGTATLEVACSGRPQAICYRTSASTWHIGRALVRGVTHVGLPNLLLQPPPIPELLQDFAPQDLAQAWMRVVGTQADLSERLRAALQPEGAAQRIGARLMTLL